MSLYDLGGDGSESPNNSLAAMLAQHLAMTGGGGGHSPGQGMSQMANSLLVWALQHPQAVQGIRDGIGNVFSGYNPNGMAASWGAMPGLNAQAAGYTAGGAPGL